MDGCDSSVASTRREVGQGAAVAKMEDWRVPHREPERPKGLAEERGREGGDGIHPSTIRLTGWTGGGRLR